MDYVIVSIMIVIMVWWRTNYDVFIVSKLQKLLLVGLAIIAAVSADVSHLKEANNDSAQNGYNYDAPSSSFNDNNAVLPENDYLPPTGSPAAPGKHFMELWKCHWISNEKC